MIRPRDDASSSSDTPPTGLTTRPVGVTKSYEAPAPAEVVRKLERAMGGRKGLVAALLHNPADDSLAYVIGLLADPRNDARDLPALCAAGRITVGELIEAYKRGRMAAAQVEAIGHVADNLAGVVGDVMARARPYWDPCRDCQGTGSITPDPTKKTPNPVPEPCDACLATGQILVIPDLARQQVALELGGLGPKRAPMVDLSDRRKLTVTDGSATGLVSLIGAVDKLLHARVAARPAPIVDGEVIGDAPTGPDALPPASRQTPPADVD